MTKSHGSHVSFFVFFSLFLFITIIDNTSALLYYRGRLYFYFPIVCLSTLKDRAAGWLFFLFSILFSYFLRLPFIDFRYVRMPRGRDSVSVSFFFFLFSTIYKTFLYFCIF